MRAMSVSVLRQLHRASVRLAFRKTVVIDCVSCVIPGTPIEPVAVLGCSGVSCCRNEEITVQRNYHVSIDQPTESNPEIDKRRKRQISSGDFRLYSLKLPAARTEQEVNTWTDATTRSRSWCAES